MPTSLFGLYTELLCTSFSWVISLEVRDQIAQWTNARAVNVERAARLTPCLAFLAAATNARDAQTSWHFVNRLLYWRKREARGNAHDLYHHRRARSAAAVGDASVARRLRSLCSRLPPLLCGEDYCSGGCCGGRAGAVAWTGCLASLLAFAYTSVVMVLAFVYASTGDAMCQQYWVGAPPAGTCGVFSCSCLMIVCDCCGAACEQHLHHAQG
jgi:hypothetical protein